MSRQPAARTVVLLKLGRALLQRKNNIKAGNDSVHENDRPHRLWKTAFPIASRAERLQCRSLSQVPITLLQAMHL